MDSVLQLLPAVSLIFVGYIVVAVLLYYFFIVRKLHKRRDAFIKVHESLRVGQEVVLLNGIYGKVVRIYDEYCDVELNSNNVIKVSRFAISSIK